LIALADFYSTRDSGPADAANALKYYQLALDLQIDPKDPDRQQALIGVARASLDNGSPSDLVFASTAFLQALSISSGDPSVWYDYARSLAAQASSDPNAVQAALQRTLDLDQSYADQALGPDWSAYFARLEASIGPLLRGAQHNELGHTYRNQGEIDLAAAEFISATLEDPASKRYWRDLADTQFQRRQFADAAVAYQNAIDRSPAIDPNLLTQLGLCRAGNNEYEAAVTAFRAAIDALQGAAPATTYSSLGDALYALKRYDEASAAYEQAAARDVNNLSYAYQEGLSSFNAGQGSAAATAMQLILKNGYVAVNLADGADIRSDVNEATVLATVPFGAVLQLIDGPLSNGTQFFWHVRDANGTIDGYVLVDAVVPIAPPTVVSPAQLTTP
jgi:tetratricopeptide (TPR) repeat protein